MTFELSSIINGVRIGCIFDQPIFNGFAADDGFGMILDLNKLIGNIPIYRKFIVFSTILEFYRIDIAVGIIPGNTSLYHGFHIFFQCYDFLIILAILWFLVAACFLDIQGFLCTKDTADHLFFKLIFPYSISIYFLLDLVFVIACVLWICTDRNRDVLLFKTFKIMKNLC